jgi:biopolymer transport protein ExbD
MAQLNDNNITQQPKAGVKRMLKSNIRIDMTPMVDLVFLLITFFVFTAQLAKPTAMDIAMPKDNAITDPVEIGESYVITVLPNGKDIYYYEGFFEKAKAANAIYTTTLEELRHTIVKKKKTLSNKAVYKDGPEGLMILIKPSADANYKSVIDALDECTISNVKKYALLKISDEEKLWLNKAK